MNTKKLVHTLALSAAALLPVLAGCSGSGGGSGAPSPSPSSAPSAAPSSAPAAEAPAGSPAAEPEPFDLGGYTVRYAMWWDGAPNVNDPTGEMQAARDEELMKKYNFTFEFLNIPHSEIVEKLTSSALAGDPMADIVYLEAKQAIPALAESGIIQPLDDYFDFSDPRFPENLKEYAMYKGKIYGFLHKADSSHGIWYNKKLLNEAGLPDIYELQKKGEWTWDKYLEIAKATTKDFDGDGNIDQWGITIGYDITDHFLYSNNARITEEVDGKFQFVLDSPQAIEALDFVGKLFSEHKVATFQSQGLFEAGKAALYGGETWMGPALAARIGAENLGFAAYPNGPSNPDKSKYTSVTTNTGIYTFPATAKHPKEVAQIMMERALWDNVENEIFTFLESNMPNPESMELARELMRVNKLNNVEAFPGLNDIYLQILDRVRSGESAATVVQELKPAAVDTINALLNR